MKRVWSYSVMQIAGLVGMNIAGWWLASLVAKSDPTLVQMSSFAVAHQLRNTVAFVPSLLIEGSFAEMANGKAKLEKTPDNVMAFCTYASILVSLLVAGGGIIIVPWALALVYGKAYVGAGGATSLALATAVVHMDSGSASARLSILSIKTAGIVNTAWAVFVAVAATLFLLREGDATRGAGVYLAAHLFSATLFLGSLKRRGNMPKGMIAAFTLGTGCILSLASVSVLRERLPAFTVGLTLIMALLWIGTVALLIRLGKRRYWLPSPEMLTRFLHHLPFRRLSRK